MSFADKLLETLPNLYIGLCVKCFSEVLILSNGVTLLKMCNTCKYWCILRDNTYSYYFYGNDKPSLAYTIDHSGIIHIQKPDMS